MTEKVLTCSTIKLVENISNESIEVKQKTINKHKGLICLVAQRMTESIQKGNKIIWMGNGGSAADAQHLAGELVGRFKFERPPIPSLALNANTSALTAIGNDYGFHYIYARQLTAMANEGDIVVGISTSGNSKNIIEAFKEARRLNCCTVGLTGIGGGELAHWADFLLDVQSGDTPRIQETHILIGHILCEMIETGMSGLK